jgi:prolyl-tRNA editing enzyme YbaK/EbsC (Cys-tRNA(Pro) deacylase)
MLDFMSDEPMNSNPHGAPRPLPTSAQRVQQALAAAGLDSQVIELTDAARTAQQAADALGVAVGQIAKSLIFSAAQSGRAVLVIAAGDRRVDEARVAARLGEPIERADPTFVREHSSFAIGGVAPVAHAREMVTFVDTSLQRFEIVWAAGGTPHCVFPAAPADLLRISGGEALAVND